MSCRIKLYPSAAPHVEPGTSLGVTVVSPSCLAILPHLRKLLFSFFWMMNTDQILIHLHSKKSKHKSESIESIFDAFEVYRTSMTVYIYIYILYVYVCVYNIYIYNNLWWRMATHGSLQAMAGEELWGTGLPTMRRINPCQPEAVKEEPTMTYYLCSMIYIYIICI